MSREDKRRQSCHDEKRLVDYARWHATEDRGNRFCNRRVASAQFRKLHQVFIGQHSGSHFRAGNRADQLHAVMSITVLRFQAPDRWGAEDDTNVAAARPEPPLRSERFLTDGQHPENNNGLEPRRRKLEAD